MATEPARCAEIECPNVQFVEKPSKEEFSSTRFCRHRRNINIIIMISYKSQLEENTYSVFEILLEK